MTVSRLPKSYKQPPKQQDDSKRDVSMEFYRGSNTENEFIKWANSPEKWVSKTRQKKADRKMDNERHPPNENGGLTRMQKALIGDALIKFISAELILKSTYSNACVHTVQSNAFMKQTILDSGLFHLTTDMQIRKVHDYGTVYEAHVYDIYRTEGLESATEFIKKTLLRNFNL